MSLRSNSLLLTIFGRGTYDTDRPPIINIISRDTGEHRYFVCHHADMATCHDLIEANSSLLCSDEWRSYYGAHPNHHTVCHSVNEWARDDDGDGQVDQSTYSRPEIQRVFDEIKQDLITPEERAHMIEEGCMEEMPDEGERIGTIKTARAKLISLLQRLFGELPQETLTLIEETESIALLDQWFERGLVVERLDEINFGAVLD